MLRYFFKHFDWLLTFSTNQNALKIALRKFYAVKYLLNQSLVLILKQIFST